MGVSTVVTVCLQEGWELAGRQGISKLCRRLRTAEPHRRQRPRGGGPEDGEAEACAAPGVLGQEGRAAAGAGHGAARRPRRPLPVVQVTTDPRHLSRVLTGRLEEEVEEVVEELVVRLRDYLASLQVPTDTDELFILVLRGLDEAIQKVARFNLTICNW